MSAVPTEDLLLTALLSSPGADAATDPEPRPLRDTIEQLAADGSRLSTNVEFLATIDTLVDRGLVDRTQSDDGAVVLELTEDGVDRARTARDDVAETRVELVRNGGREDVRLLEAAERTDSSMVEIAAACDETMVHRTEPESAEESIVDRTTERDRWSDCLDRLESGAGGAVALVSGPGGIGKTTFVDHMLRAAEDRAFDVARQRCPGENSEPYQPLRDLCSQLLDGPSPFEAAGVDVEDADAYEAQRSALFAELTASILPDDDPPLVVALDDLHDADPGTLAFLEAFVSDLESAPVAFVAAFRPEALPEDAPAVLTSEEHARHVSRFDLDTFDRADTAALIEQTLDRRGVPDAFLSAVQARTDGHPLFVEATVETLLETDQLAPDFEWFPEEASAIELPDRIQATVHELLAPLDDDARDLLRWIAVAGSPIPIGALSALDGEHPDRVRTAVAVLDQTGVLTRPGDDSVALRNDVVREAVLTSIDGAERRRRHVELAEALLAYDDPDDGTGPPEAASDQQTGEHAAAIARHYEQAGRSSPAMGWYRRAADRATDVYAHEAALQRYHDALDLAREIDDREELLNTAESIASVHRTVGEYDEARQYVQFVRERTDDGDVERRQRVARHAAEVAVARGECETAIEAAQRGLDVDGGSARERCRLLGAKARAEFDLTAYDDAIDTARSQRTLAADIDDDGLRAQASRRLGQVAWKQQRYEDAREFLRAAIEAYERAGDDHGAGRARNTLGLVARKQSDYQRAREYHLAALDTFDAVGDRHEAAKAENNLGLVCRDLGEFDSAREHYRRAMDGLEMVGNEYNVAVVRNNLAQIATEQGRYDRAEAYSSESLELYREMGNRVHVGLALLNLGRADRNRGWYDRARSRFEEARDIFADTGSTISAARARMHLGILARYRGEFDRARGLVEEARTVLADHGDRHRAARCAGELAELARIDGRYDRAAEHLDTAVETYEEIGTNRRDGGPSIIRARIALDRGEYGTALEHAEAAVGTFDEIGMVHWRAFARLDAGRIERERTDSTMAREHFRAAADTFETCDAPHDAVAALRGLVRTADDDVSPATVREWCDRGCRLAEGAADRAAIDEADVEWFSDRRP